MDSELKDKVAVITGGSGFIGSAIAYALAERNVKTAIIGRNQAKAMQIAEGISQKTGNTSIGIQANVLDRKGLIYAKETINKSLGNISYLINCAGGGSPAAATSMEQIESTDKLEGSFFDLSMEGFQQVFDLNINGTVLPCLVFMQDMMKNNFGSVVNVSSMGAIQPLTKTPAYSAAKAAVDNFTKWMAVHFAKTAVRINAIAPGFFATKQNKFLLFNDDGSLSARGHKIIANTPMGRFGKVENLTGTVIYLLSDASEFVTGTIIPVDGGFNAYGGV